MNYCRALTLAEKESKKARLARGLFVNRRMALQVWEKTVSEERAFVENWWTRKFSMPNLPTDDDVIMVSHALDLLKAFRGAGDAKWMKGSTEKGFLEAWWLRKFPANPLKWGSVLSLAEAEELLIEFRKSNEATEPKSLKKKAKERKVAQHKLTS